MSRVHGTLVALLVAVAGFASGSGVLPASATSGSGGDWWQQLPLMPLSCQMEVTVEPATSTVAVRCVLNLEVKGEPSLHGDVAGACYQIAVPEGFVIEGATTETEGTGTGLDRDLADPIISNSGTAAYLPQAWRLDAEGHRLKQVSEVGSTRRVTLSYRGAPLEPRRAYTGSGCAWVTAARQWLPLLDNRIPPDEFWAVFPFRLAVTVPRDWTVLVPGCAATTVKPGGDGRATFTFESDGGGATDRGEPGGRATPIRWVAGPYASDGPQRTEGGASYQIWRLLGDGHLAAVLDRDVSGFLDYAAVNLGLFPKSLVTAVQVSRELEGALALPGTRTILTAAVPFRTDTFLWMGFRVVCVRELLLALAPYFDPGLAEDVAVDFIRRSDQALVDDLLMTKRELLTEQIQGNPWYSGGAEMGDRTVAGAAATWSRMADPGSLREPFIFLYGKPALTWEMFRAIFGQEAMTGLLRKLASEGAGHDPEDVTGWFALVRRSMGDVAGEDATRFYDRWIAEAHRFDLTVRNASAVKTQAGTWLVRFTVAGNREGSLTSDLTAGGTVPWVDVAVTCYAGAVRTERVSLNRPAASPAEELTIELACPGRPIRVELDPDHVLLDYDLSNNVVGVRSALVRAVRTALLIAVLAALAVGLVALWGKTRGDKAKRPR